LELRAYQLEDYRKQSAVYGASHQAELMADTILIPAAGLAARNKAYFPNPS
jgi:hypothetical protein